MKVLYFLFLNFNLIIFAKLPLEQCQNYVANNSNSSIESCSYINNNYETNFYKGYNEEVLEVRQFNKRLANICNINFPLINLVTKNGGRKKLWDGESNINNVIDNLGYIVLRYDKDLDTDESKHNCKDLFPIISIKVINKNFAENFFNPFSVGNYLVQTKNQNFLYVFDKNFKKINLRIFHPKLDEIIYDAEVSIDGRLMVVIFNKTFRKYFLNFWDVETGNMTPVNVFKDMKSPLFLKRWNERQFVIYFSKNGRPSIAQIGKDGLVELIYKVNTPTIFTRSNFVKPSVFKL